MDLKDIRLLRDGIKSLLEVFIPQNLREGTKLVSTTDAVLDVKNTIRPDDTHKM